jgi:ATP-dependent phosphofructokinase / diphosphate-dependent phosphofructokinase
MNKNLVIGQSGGPTQVINASLAGILSEAKGSGIYSNYYGMAHGIEGVLKDQFYDLTGEPNETIEKLPFTPSSILGSCRYKLKVTDYQRILMVFAQHDVHAMIYIGGNDSMDTCYQLSKQAKVIGYDLAIVGVPKTIDNDLACTDHTPGFGSAARFIALCTRDVGLDLEAMETFDDVIVFETMGRNAGWLAASAGLAKVNEDDAPHLIYVPEIPFDEYRFLNEVINVHSKLGRVFIVACEGLRYPDGNMVGLAAIGGASKDSFGHPLVALTTGVASYLANLVSDRLKLRSRFLRPGLIGRAMSACISEVDRKEAFSVGQEAFRLLASGKTDCMVTLERISNQPYLFRCGNISLQEVANQEKLLPREYLNDKGNMINQDFVNYAQPLIDGPLMQIARLRKTFVNSFEEKDHVS